MTGYGIPWWFTTLIVTLVLVTIVIAAAEGALVFIRAAAYVLGAR